MFGISPIPENAAVNHTTKDDKNIELTRIIQQQEDYDKVLVNPLAGLQHATVSRLGECFVDDYGLTIDGYDHNHVVRLFGTAAILAQKNDIWRDFRYDTAEKPHLDLSREERKWLEREETNMLDQPLRLYFIIIACALSAAVQGWNETAPNGGEYTFFSDKETSAKIFSQHFLSKSIQS